MSQFLGFRFIFHPVYYISIYIYNSISIYSYNSIYVQDEAISPSLQNPWLHPRHYGPGEGYNGMAGKELEEWCEKPRWQMKVFCPVGIPQVAGNNVSCHPESGNWNPGWEVDPSGINGPNRFRLINLWWIFHCCVLSTIQKWCRSLSINCNNMKTQVVSKKRGQTSENIIKQTDFLGGCKQILYHWKL